MPTRPWLRWPVKGKAAPVKMFAVVDRAARLTAGRTLDGGKPIDLPVVQATNPRMPFAALQESAPGTKRSKADMAISERHVCF